MTRLVLLLGVASVLLAEPARAEWASGAQSEVPLDGDGAAWRVRATLDGTVSGLFLLDTGASLCVLTPAVARRLGLAPKGQDHQQDHQQGHQMIQLQTANGIVTAPLVQLRSIDVGGNRTRDVMAVVHPAVPPPLDGVIGLSFLDHFTYSIDPRRHILRLR